MRRTDLLEILCSSIDELWLSTRPYNCFKEAGILFIGDLVQRGTSDLLKLKGFGKKSLMEVEALLSECHLHLSMNLDWHTKNSFLEKREQIIALLRQRLTPDIKGPIRKITKYRIPSSCIDEKGLNCELNTIHGDKISELLGNFRNSIELTPPVDGLKEKLDEALFNLQFFYPLWIVSVDKRRCELSKGLTRYCRNRPPLPLLPLISKSESTPMPKHDYVSRFLGWRLKNWSLYSGHPIGSEGPPPYFRFRQRSADWVELTSKIYKLLKYKDNVWSSIHASFKDYKGGNLDLPSVIDIRCAVVDLLCNQIALIAKNKFEEAISFNPFLELTAAGNITAGFAEKRWGFQDPETIFLVITA